MGHSCLFLVTPGEEKPRYSRKNTTTDFIITHWTMQGVYVDTVFGFSLNLNLHNCWYFLIQNKTRWWVISPLGVLQLCAARKILSVWVIKPIDFPHMHKYTHRSSLSPSAGQVRLNLDSQVCHQKIYPFPNTPWMACHIPAFIISTSINQTTRLYVCKYGSIPAVYHSKAAFLKLQLCLPGTFVSFGQLLGGSFAPFTPPTYQVNAAAGLL